MQKRTGTEQAGRTLDREQRRRIREAERNLIPVPKKAGKALGLLAADPEGVFRFADGRWVRIFRIPGDPSRDVPWGDAAGKAGSMIRISRDTDAEETYLTLTVRGETYDEVRNTLRMDQSALSVHTPLSPLTIDEAMERVSGEKFSYASAVRGRKDWGGAFPEIAGQRMSCQRNGQYGAAYFVMQYPMESSEELFRNLTEIYQECSTIGCAVTFAVDITCLSREDQTSWSRSLRERSGMRAGNADRADYLNLSTQIVFFSDSEDARSIIGKTIEQIFMEKGFLVVPAIGAQETAAGSVLTLGLSPHALFRIVLM